VADNDGQHVKVLAGLTDGQNVALNVGQSINEGDKVRPIPAEAPAAPAPAK
jgi:hypothetical protein